MPRRFRRLQHFQQSTRFSRTVMAGSALPLLLVPMLPVMLPGVALAQDTEAQTVAPVQIETTPGASTSLRAQFAAMVRQSGKVLSFAPEGDADADAAEIATERFVLYAPLNQLWLLDGAGAVVDYADIEVRQTPFDHLVLHWMQFSDAAVSDIIPAAARMSPFTVTGDTPHPLASAYDALLTRPLVRAIYPLPVGAYFSASGHIFDDAGAHIGEWNNYGPEIAFRMTPSESDAANTETKAVARQWWFAVTALAAALTPEQADP